MFKIGDILQQRSDLVEVLDINRSLYELRYTDGRIVFWQHKNHTHEQFILFTSKSAKSFKANNIKVELV